MNAGALTKVEGLKPESNNMPLSKTSKPGSSYVRKSSWRRSCSCSCSYRRSLLRWACMSSSWEHEGFFVSHCRVFRSVRCSLRFQASQTHGSVLGCLVEYESVNQSIHAWSRKVLSCTNLYVTRLSVIRHGWPTLHLKLLVELNNSCNQSMIICESMESTRPEDVKRRERFRCLE